MPHSDQDTVEDFFTVYAAWEKYLLARFELFPHWGPDSSLCGLEVVDDFDGEWSFKHNEIAEMLDKDVDSIKSFFSVHCCVDNMIPELIGQDRYILWDVDNGKVFVEIASREYQYFGVADIVKLMKDTEHMDWSFETLLKNNN